MTDYTEIYDLFLAEVKDYKLDILVASTPVLANYLCGFLKLAIPNFKNCLQDLEDRDDTTQTFNITLTETEKHIVVRWMVYEWFLREVQDVTQFNLSLSDTDFKRYAEANNLRSKQEYANGLREINSQKNTDYGLKGINWDAWIGGNFSD